MGDIPVSVGDKVVFRKTVSETDVYLYAGITGDFSPNHIDATSERAKAQGGRIAHGAMMIGFMSTASSHMSARHTIPSVSYGYDRVRFIRPVRFGDTVEVVYEISEVDAEQDRSIATVTCKNQNGDVVAAAQHITKFRPYAKVKKV